MSLLSKLTGKRKFVLNFPRRQRKTLLLNQQLKEVNLVAKHGRWFRPKDPSLKGTSYDSKLEQRLHEGELKGADHHPPPVAYIIEKKYNPDFMFKLNDKVIYIESKGYFQDRQDSAKYPWVKTYLKENEELVFVFENPDKPIHFQRPRKDGTKMTHGEWCIKNGFRYFSEENLCLQKLFHLES